MTEPTKPTEPMDETQLVGAETPAGEGAEVPPEPGSFSYKAWYEKNKGEYNQARISRYSQDPTYREKVLAWNRESRQRRRAQQQATQTEEDAARKVPKVNKHFNTVMQTVKDADGKEVEVELHSIGALARFVNRSVQVVRSWEAGGLFPTTPYHNTKGDRLYTQAQMEVIRDVLSKQGKLRDQGRRQKQLYRPAVFQVRMADGTECPLVFYRVGVLASLLSLTIPTLQHMQERGLIPGTPFSYSQTEYRLYTTAMIRAVVAVFEKYGPARRDASNKEAVYNEIHDAWEKQGVFGAQLLRVVDVPRDVLVAASEGFEGMGAMSRTEGDDDAVEDEREDAEEDAVEGAE